MDYTNFSKIARIAASEGIVMLENKILPISDDCSVAIFGRNQLNYFKSGTGSGGLVNVPYSFSVLDALKETNLKINGELLKIYEDFVKVNPFDKGHGWATEPWCQKELLLNDNIVKKARENSDIAITNIGRLNGEDKDLVLEKGSFLLNDEEEVMLSLVTKYFDKTIVLVNSGNLIDFSWIKKYNPSAVLLIWQGGVEGGHGVADIIIGKTSPSGRLPSTIISTIELKEQLKNFGSKNESKYVEDVCLGYRHYDYINDEFSPLYQFGYGLSYTNFAYSDCEISLKDYLEIKGNIKNIGCVSGKEATLVFVSKPQVDGLLNPTKCLVGFSKSSEILPGNLESFNIKVNLYDLAYFDEAKSRFITKKGIYKLFIGGDSKEYAIQKEFEIKEDILYPVLNDAMDTVKFDYNCDYVSNYSGDKGYKLIDVYNGKISLNTFIDQLSDLDMVHMFRGEGQHSPKVKTDTTGIFGGTTPNLQHFGIPIACCNDGPSGIRLDNGAIAFQIPSGTSLASTFNMDLVSGLYENIGLELVSYDIDLLLGPGINIHRNPLNGRNFEYFSEDPYLTGKMAVSALLGLQKHNVNGVIKHMCCNNQEAYRHDVNAKVSKRALREIYLKPFEMAIKEGNAKAIMTSYNPVNGWWSSSNYDLNTLVVREDYGFKGILMSDWIARGGNLYEEGFYGDIKNQASMIKAGEDLYMAGGEAITNPFNDDIEAKLKEGYITRNELARMASHILEFILSSNAMRRIEE